MTDPTSKSAANLPDNPPYSCPYCGEPANDIAVISPSPGMVVFFHPDCGMIINCQLLPPVRKPENRLVTPS